MYLLFVSSGLMLFYVIYTCIFSNFFTIKNVKTFDYKSEEYDFIIDNLHERRRNACDSDQKKKSRRGSKLIESHICRGGSSRAA